MIIITYLVLSTEQETMMRDRSRHERSSSHALALNCIEEAIREAAPETATHSAVTLDGKTLSLQGTTYDLT